ncbi:phosphatidylethanolamine-binding protein 4 isoform X1 [Tachysurus fulvidraco]|uniref:phosphatidylethanolamine-binding protein 4 isoform X1 n=1 Tax=Tachysurus fulvidraco TaxID=1234273 RepID=UPI001FF06C99|nr:phosphatidylethanolamine-binding protein 4 isoform X1 [Tachysurus fulvidraco]XP_047678785.1 phosphatidylethanolamine-binding protein 4 isoform X1 [Tachysurus fulvidraco]
MFFRAVLLLVVACVQRSCQHQSGPLKDEVLTEDRRFCRGELEISYPDLDIRSCMIIPQEFREKISQEWGPPQVRLAMADKQKKYTLIMVDPDAPSRTNPSRAYWRHWLLADIEGSSLKEGDIKGTLLSEYTPPTPPKRTGFHRYKFLLYEQNTGQVLSLSQQEQQSLGNWDPEAFVEKFELVGPVASLLFLTQHFKD